MKRHMDKQTDRKQGEMLADERAFRLMEAFSGVDEELLERSERSEKVTPIAAFRKNVWKYGRVCAAVLCLFVVGVLTWGGYHVGMDNAATGAAESAREEAVYVYDNETAVILPNTESYTQAVDAAGDAQEKVTAESTSGVGGSSGSTGSQDGGREDNAGVNATVGATDSLESSVTNGAEYNAVPHSGEKEGAISEAESDSSASPEMKAREITLEEAYKIEGLGEYIPTVLPAGYMLESVHALESVSYNHQEGAKSLTVCWSRGMDSIFWHIGQEADSLNIVDLKKTETYDEYLYEIPHAETVPEEYREIFSNPVCRFEDFSLEFVEKRMISRGGDAGDTDTPRGNFSVLYPDGVVVKFNGRGTAEEVWQMFSSIGKD